MLPCPELLVIPICSSISLLDAIITVCSLIFNLWLSPVMDCLQSCWSKILAAKFMSSSPHQGWLIACSTNKPKILSWNIETNFVISIKDRSSYTGGLDQLGYGYEFNAIWLKCSFLQGRSGSPFVNIVAEGNACQYWSQILTILKLIKRILKSCSL